MSVESKAVSTSTEGANRPLLLCGVIAGPLYVATGIFQAMIREGFDPTRHALSILANGDLGWIQIANFVIAGVLVIGAALGLNDAMHKGPVRIWGPLLLAVYGLGLVGAGFFVADPAPDFPPIVAMPGGTLPSATPIMTHDGFLHFVFGGTGFFGLIAAAMVFARRFARDGRTGWATFSAATGILFFVAFAGIASGNAAPWLILAFTGAIILAWTWLTAISLYFMRNPQG